MTFLCFSDGVAEQRGTHMLASTVRETAPRMSREKGLSPWSGSSREVCRECRTLASDLFPNPSITFESWLVWLVTDNHRTVRLAVNGKNEPISERQLCLRQRADDLSAAAAGGVFVC